MLKKIVIKFYYYVQRFFQKLLKHDFVIPFRRSSRLFISYPPGSALKFAIEKDGFKDLAMILETLNKGETFFDVGANFGHYSLAVHDRFGGDINIHGFEPELDAFRRFISNRQINQAKWKCHNFGLGSEEGWLSMTEDLGGFNHITTDGSGEQSVRILTLDQYLESIDINIVNVMKIDVEGYELFVLKGAEKALSGHRIKKIFFEVDDHESRYDVSRDDYSKLLSSLGYSKRMLSEGNFELWEC